MIFPSSFDHLIIQNYSPIYNKGGKRIKRKSHRRKTRRNKTNKTKTRRRYN